MASQFPSLIVILALLGGNLSACATSEQNNMELEGYKPETHAYISSKPTRIVVNNAQQNWYRFGSRYYTRASTSGQLNLFNCSDFPNTHSAQNFFISNGGPFNDPHDLDRDGDGFACEWDPRIYKRVPATTSKSSGGNCHWVSAHYRNGSYVKGHRRCR